MTLCWLLVGIEIVTVLVILGAIYRFSGRRN